MKKWLALMIPASVLFPAIVAAQIMLPPFKHSDTSYVSPCFPLWSLAADGAETLSGVTGSTSNLSVTLQTDVDSSADSITTNTNILTLGTVGTYSAPTSNARVRFGECSASSGMYQLMLHNDQVAVPGAGVLSIKISDTGDTFLDQVLILNQDVADLTDIGDELDDRFDTTEIEPGLTRDCALILLVAEAVGEFVRVPDGDDPGTTTYKATDDVTTRIVGTLAALALARTDVTRSCP